MSEERGQVERRGAWQWDMKISLGIILGMLTQSATAIWWAAGVTMKLDILTEQVIEFKQERNNHNITARDLAVLAQRVESNERRIYAMEMNRRR